MRGIHRSRVDSPHKGQSRGALVFALICASTTGWTNNRDIGDLRRHRRAHYDVTVVVCQCILLVDEINQNLMLNRYLISEWNWKYWPMSFSGVSVSRLYAIRRARIVKKDRFPSQKPVTQSFGISLISAWTNGSRRRWLETPLRSSWPHCNEIILTGDNPLGWRTFSHVPQVT